MSSVMKSTASFERFIPPSILATTPRDVPRELFVPTLWVNLLANVIDVWLCLVVCLLGVITNILSIRVFVRMGFTDTVNVTMTTISFWDLVRVTSGAVNRFHGPISLFSPAFGKSWQNICITNLNHLHFMSGNVSYVLGAYVAVERCVCISLPFKVKSIMTRDRTIFVCIILSIITFGTLSPQFLIYEYKWVYNADYNTTIAIYQNTDVFKLLLGLNFTIVYKCLGFLYPVLCLTIMVVSTCIISYHLKKSSTFKLKFTTVKNVAVGDNSQAKFSSKEKQVVKMLLVVICVYIINLAPRVLQYLAMLVEPEYNTLKVYNNLFWTNVYLISVVDFVNASVHLFIFYKISSNSNLRLLKCFSRSKR